VLGIDRIAVTQTVNPHAGVRSDIGLCTGVASFAVLDSLSTGFRDRWEAALVDAGMYAESLTISLAITDVVRKQLRNATPLG
jgi:hypothetical protein